jgi:predicted regulator of Ras-like GTPase activity (Roadblock/LC7/MglB family)
MDEIEKIIDDLFKDQNIQQCIVSTVDGSPIFGKTRGKKDTGEELHVIPAAITSALSISHGFLEGNLNDEVQEYVVFQEQSILIATKAMGGTVLITTIQIPKSSFEKRPQIDQCVEQLREAAAKIDAIVKTMEGVDEPLIEKLQRAIPEATAILLLSPVGIPLSDLLSSLDVDPAQLAAVSSALSLPTRILGGEAQSIAVTGKNNAILLFSLDADRILMVTLKPKLSVESYLTKISRIVSPQS